MRDRSAILEGQHNSIDRLDNEYPARCSAHHEYEHEYDSEARSDAAASDIIRRR